ncbi:MAG: hypothetical protein U9R66_01935 [Thermodesulfobacteriota bacterium]|nr:hypothetical protein [Thermodesulfobacteriota bacterium]
MESKGSPSLVKFRDIKESIKGWEEYLREGGQYLATAENGFAKRQNVFTTEILYNLIAMAIEKLVMGILMQSGNLPYNHTMKDLVEAMDEFLPGRLDGLRDRLIALDAYQDICDLESYSIKPPAMAEIPAMLSLARELRAIAGVETGD